MAATLPRGPVQVTVLDASGNPVSGVPVTILVRGGSATTLYSSEFGGATAANPATTDGFGRISGWVPRGAYTAFVNGSGLSYSEHFDVFPPEWSPAVVPIGSPLPSSPADGEECLYQASSSVYWHLRYSSTSAKWEYVGGPPLRSYVGGPLGPLAASASNAIVTSGPSISFPFLGTYEVESYANARCTTSASLNFGVFPSVNNVACFPTASSPRMASYIATAMQTGHVRGIYTVASLANALRMSISSFTIPVPDLHIWDMTLSITPNRLNP
jgi:hypothetical protein